LIPALKLQRLSAGKWRNKKLEMVRRDLSAVAFQQLLDCRRDSDRKSRVHREEFGLIEFRCNLNLFELPDRSLTKDQIR
jgi:hypothetical protein